MDKKSGALQWFIDVLDSDLDLRQSIEQSDEDIRQGKIFTTDEIIEQIKQGKL
ncbi:hypothetical protein [Paenibacillus chungangensis]|uniref:Uncharacterized protein n=1 Tax=Paenibacillus chungangensis TaxID=696535 RepID=A0ABW3HW16_9BACL